MTPNPKGTVCVSYIKTRSASAFWQKVTEVMEFHEPAEGIFKASFEKHSGDMGTYYSLKWDWRERQTTEELEQLEAIAVFLQSQPRLVDLNTTREMMCIDALSASEISSLVCSAKSGELEQPLQISAEARK